MAVSDPGGTLARPLEVITADSLVEYLRKLLVEEGIAEVVVGIPRTLGGEAGFQAERVLDTLIVLKRAFPTVRFVEWDERLTTRVARSSRSTTAGRRSGGRAGRRKGRARRQRVDHLAAAVMLQEYLDQRGKLEATRQGSP